MRDLSGEYFVELIGDPIPPARFGALATQNALILSKTGSLRELPGEPFVIDGKTVQIDQPVMFYGNKTAIKGTVFIF